MRRFLVLSAASVLGITITALGWVAVEIARQSNREEARKADVIVVLGAAEYMGRPSPVLKARLNHALDLYHKGLAPLILATGGSGLNSRFTEAEAARDYLVQHGVPSENVLLEAEGTSTFQSTLAAAEMLHWLGLSKCIVVSDGYHIFRAKRMLEARGIQVYGSPRRSTPEGPLHEGWLYLRQSAGYWLWRMNLAR